jgi:hypothetical protein
LHDLQAVLASLLTIAGIWSDNLREDERGIIYVSLWQQDEIANLQYISQLLPFLFEGRRAEKG